MNNTTWIAYGKTDAGMKRSSNQDRFLDLSDKKLWIVADGMGGHKNGADASQAIVDAFFPFTPQKTLGATVFDVYDKLRQVNNKLYGQSNGGDINQIVGSTVALLLVHQNHCVALWSGDSRIYLFRNSKFVQLTHDHNYAAFLSQCAEGEELAKSHPFGQALTHAIGSEPELYLESRLCEVKSNDIFLLCSDGLNKELSDAEIESILQTNAVADVVEACLGRSLERGAKDNVTLIVVQLTGKPERRVV